MKTTRACLPALAVVLLAGCASESPTTPPESTRAQVVISGLVFEKIGDLRVPVRDVDVFLEDYFGVVGATTESYIDGKYSVRAPDSFHCPCTVVLEAEKPGFNRSMVVPGTLSIPWTVDIEMFRGN